VITTHLNTSGYIDDGEFIHKLSEYQLAKTDCVPHYLYYSNDITAVIGGSLSPRHSIPQVADGGTASSMEGSCEYIE
jgi:hypothetical protein